MKISRVLPISLSLLTIACGGGKVDVQLFEVGSEDNIEGLTVTTDSDQATTNGRGKARLKVAPDGGYVITVSDPTGQRLVHDILQNGEEQNYYVGHGVLSSAEAERITSGLGATLDPSLGILVVGATWLEDNLDINEMVGATVEIDASYEIAVVEDPGSEVGWQLGTTVPSNVNYATVAFGNVTPGDVRVTVTYPEPVDSCGVWPSNVDDSWGDAVPVKAGQVTSYTLICTRAEAARALPGAREASDRPWVAQGIAARVADAGSDAGTLRLEAEVELPGVAHRAPKARFEVAASPAQAPTHINLEVSSSGAALKVTLDTEHARVQLDVDGEPLALTHHADGTLALGDAIYPGPDALVAALATDPRLATLDDAAYSAWIVALYEVKAAAPTRFATTNADAVNVLTSTGFPGRLGCARLGEGSASCRLWRALRSSR